MRLRRMVLGMQDRGLRARWAGQANRRSGKAYEAAQAAWSDTNAELQGMVVTACSYTGMGGGQLATAVGLRRDETLLWTGAGVSLVEAAAWPALQPADYQALTVELLTESFEALPSAELRTLDTGSVALTDQRLVFVGESPIRRRREWPFADLLGLVHTPDTPCTLLDVAAEPHARKAMSGLLLAPEAVAEFRFVVSLALAEGAGERAAFVAYLERLLDAHQHARPAPPPMVTSRDAPHSVRLGLVAAKGAVFGDSGGSMGGQALRLAGAVGAAFIVFNLVTPNSPNGQVLSQPPLTTSPAASAPVALPVPDRVLSSPTTGPTSAQPGSQPTQQGRPEAKSTTTRATPPKPKATTTQQPKPPRRESRNERQVPDRDSGGDWSCGAPPNPFLYNFCGGQTIDSPNSEVCRFFRCAQGFWQNNGFMVECADGNVTRTGGYRNSCTGHGGDRHIVYTFYSNRPGWVQRAQGPEIWGPPALDWDRDHRHR